MSRVGGRQFFGGTVARSGKKQGDEINGHDAFQARMEVQRQHVERYRLEVLHSTGRVLSAMVTLPRSVSFFRSPLRR